MGLRPALNGIAYDAAGRRLFVTGKLWPKVFEVRLTPLRKDGDRTDHPRKVQPSERQRRTLPIKSERKGYVSSADGQRSNHRWSSRRAGQPGRWTDDSTLCVAGL